MSKIREIYKDIDEEEIVFLESFKYKGLTLEEWIKQIDDLIEISSDIKIIEKKIDEVNTYIKIGRYLFLFTDLTIKRKYEKKQRLYPVGE